MDTTQLKQMKRFRRAFRFIGAMFTLVGGMLLFNFGVLLFEPNSTITVNGVVTSEYAPKLQAVIFNASFVLMGLFFLFSPSKLLNKLFVWRQSLLSIFSLKKR